MASNPSSSTRSTISRGPTSPWSKEILAVSVARDTTTVLTPGILPSSDSTVEVQDEQVMPYIRRVISSERVGGMSVASKPISEISWRRKRQARDSESIPEDEENAHVDDFDHIPM